MTQSQLSLQLDDHRSPNTSNLLQPFNEIILAHPITNQVNPIEKQKSDDLLADSQVSLPSQAQPQMPHPQQTTIPTTSLDLQ